MLNKDSKSFIVKRNELANIYDECDLLYLLIDRLLLLHVLRLHHDHHHGSVLLNNGLPLHQRVCHNFHARHAVWRSLLKRVQVYQRALLLDLYLDP